MTGLKFLLNSIRSHPILMPITVILAAASAVIPFAMNEPLGNKEYLFPKTAVFYPSFALTCIVMIILSVELTSNKSVRSLPIAKELYTRSLPILLITLTYGSAAPVMGVYMIYLSALGCSAAEFSDTLTVGAVFVFLTLVVNTLMEFVLLGGLYSVYLVFLPMIGIILLFPDEIKSKGFGITLEISVGLFAVSAVVGGVFCFWWSSFKFCRSNVKIPPMNTFY